MLEAVEVSLLDPKRESPRDVLRHAGGLSDELWDLILLVAIADEAPTSQAVQLSDEVIARTNAQVAGLDAIVVNELTALNLALRRAGPPAGPVAIWDGTPRRQSTEHDSVHDEP